MRIHENIGENVLGGETALPPPDAEFTSESHDVSTFEKASKIQLWDQRFHKYNFEYFKIHNILSQERI